MTPKPTHKQVVEFFSMFDIDIISILNNSANAVSDFERVKRQVKRKYKRRAVIEHPDKGGDEEAFKQLTNACNCIQDMVIKPRPPPRLQPMPGITVTFYGSTGTATSSTTTGGAWHA